jgi:TetR/AcrR family transcriptional regulator, mexJK operon transcriptional repressor
MSQPEDRARSAGRRSARAAPRPSRRDGGRRGRPTGGSEQKRAAITAAALRLFERDGFARTSVDAIADEAGVSKRTIYNHYGDKQTLFLSLVRDTYRSLIDAVTVMMDSCLSDLADEADVAHGITEFARELALLAALSPERQSLIRLMMTEAPHFPELRAEQLRPRGITVALAERLAKLAARGLLDVPDPEDAANHLFALTMGRVNNRSLYGAFMPPEEEVMRMATSGAAAFLRAYRPGAFAG